MLDLSSYPHPTYNANKLAAGILAMLIGISLIAWIVQSIQIRFRLRRPLILLLLSHITVFIQLILRIVLSNESFNSRTAFTVITVLLAIGQRMIIVANYSILTEVGYMKQCMARTLIVGVIISVIASATLMLPAGTLSYNMNTIGLSFLLRQISAAIVLALTILFYPIWFATKAVKYMSKSAITLLIISSTACLIVASYLLITSIPKYYIESHSFELWFYMFQLGPIIIAQITWSWFHPKRSLPTLQPTPEEAELDVAEVL